MLTTDYKFGEVYKLDSQVTADYENVHSKQIFGDENGGVAVIAFKKGQRLAEHLSPAEVMVYVIEGEVVFTMIDSPNLLKKGEFMLMGEGVPHSVLANEDSKLMLIKVKSTK